MTTQASSADQSTRPSWGAVNGRNLFLIALGTVLIVAALKGLLWYSVDNGNNVAGDGFTFDDLNQNANSLAAPVAGAFFDWLAWSLLVGAVVFGVAANVSSPVSDFARVLSFLVGLSGLIATYYALAQLFNAQRIAGGSEHTVWHNSSYGLWAALAGFVCLTVAGASGARRSA